MKIKTGSVFVDKPKADKEYEDQLKESTVTECFEFSKLYFRLFNKLGQAIEGRKAIKAEIQKLKDLEQNNETNLLKYLEHLILDNDNREFMIPYYSISNEVGHHIDDDIGKHENHYFGVLGNISDILKS